jgi:O-antigen/teichoic acid export membrane protein
MEVPLLLVAVMVIPFSIAMIIAEALRGLKRISSCQLIKSVLISLGTLALALPFIRTWQINGAIAAHTVATVLTAIGGWYMWRVAFAKNLGDNISASEKVTIKQLFHSSWPLFGVALTGMIMQHAATLSLAIWESTVEVGQFNVASRISNLLIFPLIAMVSILAPKFAALYRQQHHKDLELLARRSANLLTVISVPVAVIVSMKADVILSLFGEEFIDATWILRVLLIGMIVNAATGPVSNVLMMSGNERSVRSIMMVSALIVVGLCISLTPTYGALGAATAVCTGSVVQNCFMALMVKKKFGFWTLGFGTRQ